MTTWGEFRQKVQRSLLKDEDAVRWTVPQLDDYIEFALVAFCTHTALAKEVHRVHGDTGLSGQLYNFATDTVFDLPDDVFEPLEVSGQVLVADADGKVNYFDPIRITRGLSPGFHPVPSYAVWPDGKLNLNQPPGLTGTLILRYFAYYPAYSGDDDARMLLPRWALKPMATLTAVYAMEALAIESANLDRWKDRSDSGNPTQNALRTEASALRKTYDLELLKYPPQDRENFWRQYEA